MGGLEGISVPTRRRSRRLGGVGELVEGFGEDDPTLATERDRGGPFAARSFSAPRTFTPRSGQTATVSCSEGAIV